MKALRAVSVQSPWQYHDGSLTINSSWLSDRRHWSTLIGQSQCASAASINFFLSQSILSNIEFELLVDFTAARWRWRANGADSLRSFFIINLSSSLLLLFLLLLFERKIIWLMYWLMFGGVFTRLKTADRWRASSIRWLIVYVTFELHNGTTHCGSVMHILNPSMWTVAPPAQSIRRQLVH